MPCTTSILWRCHDDVQRVDSAVEVLDLFPRSIFKGELPVPLLATLIDLADRVLADPSANPDASSNEIVRAARLANAHDFIMDLPSGYSTPVGERGASLSGGQRQRVAIARTLLSNPKLLVMDEATSALDYETERKVCDNLLENLNDQTVFFITHRLSTIREADVIVMLHQGAVVEVGTHADLMKHRGRYYALYRQQESA